MRERPDAPLHSRHVPSYVIALIHPPFCRPVPPNRYALVPTTANVCPLRAEGGSPFRLGTSHVHDCEEEDDRRPGHHGRTGGCQGPEMSAWRPGGWNETPFVGSARRDVHRARSAEVGQHMNAVREKTTRQTSIASFTDGMSQRPEKACIQPIVRKVDRRRTHHGRCSVAYAPAWAVSVMRTVRRLVMHAERR